jgi:hypothetical protein
MAQSLRRRRRKRRKTSLHTRTHPQSQVEDVAFFSQHSYIFFFFLFTGEGAVTAELAPLFHEVYSFALSNPFL